MGKTAANAENVARTAQEMTLDMAEKELGLIIEYNTYTAQDYKEKTYDDVCTERIRSNLDDFTCSIQTCSSSLAEKVCLPTYRG